MIGPSSIPCFDTPRIWRPSSSSFLSVPLTPSLFWTISRHSFFAVPISSTDCGRRESVSIDAAMKSSTSAFFVSLSRRIPYSSASVSRCCWSSTAALNGARLTVMQSTFSVAGSFSASFRFALSTCGGRGGV